jgi:hypothetical protein
MTELLPAQIEALRLSAGKQGFAYLMEMGLAKTRTDLEDTMRWVESHDVTRAVVLAPNSFKGGWVAEIEKWGFDITPHIFESGNDWHNEAFLRKKYTSLPMVIVNYEAIRHKKTRDYITRFIGDRRAKITADESIQIGQHDSLQTEAAIELAKLCYVRRILSGKWVTQGPHNVWPQMRFIGQFDGYNFFAFKRRYCETGGFKGKQIVGPKNEEELAKRISPFVFEAFKSQYLKIGKNYTIREYKLDPIVEKHYNDMLSDFMIWLSEDETIAVDVAIAKYGKMGQIMTGFAYDEKGNARQLIPDAQNTRLQSLIQFFEGEMVSKLLVPYHHRAVFDMLMRNFGKYNPAYIRGGMSADDITEQKREFNENPNCRIMFLQDVASKYGHTLLGGPEPQNRCSTMAFFENTYSLDTRSQVEDRNHRQGQLEDNCTYVDFAGTGLDYKMTEALQRKENFFQVFMQLVKDARRKA